MICFTGCYGGEGREEGKKEGECRGGKEEDMSVGESTKSTVPVDVEFLQKSVWHFLNNISCYRACGGTVTVMYTYISQGTVVPCI